MEKVDVNRLREDLYQKVKELNGRDWFFMAANLALYAMPAASGRMIMSSRRALPTIGRVIKASQPYIQTAVIGLNSKRQGNAKDAERRYDG